MDMDTVANNQHVQMIDEGSKEEHEFRSMIDGIMRKVPQNERHLVTDILIRYDRIKYKRAGQWIDFPDTLSPNVFGYESFVGSLRHPDGTAYKPNGMRDIKAGMETEGGLRVRFMVFAVNQKPFMTIRILPRKIQKFSELGFSEKDAARLEQISKIRNGVILFVGPTGHGKSTTMTSMLEHIVVTSREGEHTPHILTIEDPVENRIGSRDEDNVTQREVGLDIPSFRHGFVSALRQTPDIIAIGEVKEDDEFKQLFWMGAAGHLTFGTMHAFDCEQALNVIYDKLDGPRANRAVLSAMSSQLVAIVAQRLVRLKVGRVQLVYEILDLTKEDAAAAIRNYNFNQTADILRRNGMPRLDDQISQLVETGKISDEEANRVMRLQR